MSVSACLDWSKLSEYPIFQDLTDEELRHFLQDVQHEVFHLGDLLLKQGETAHGLGILLCGKVNGWRAEADGKQHFLSVLDLNPAWELARLAREGLAEVQSHRQAHK